MRVAVFGWYGHNNAGDERIKYCLNSFLMNLGGIKQVNFYDLHDHAIKGKTNKFDQYDLVIIGGGGLIFSQNNYHDFINGISTKVITAGISVETILVGNPKKFAIALLEKSEIFLVRDQGSYEKLEKLDINKKVKVSSDLTFLAPYEIVNNQEENLIGVNLLSKTNHTNLTLKFEIFLSRFSKKFSPKVIDFSKLISDLSQSYELLPIPLYCVPHDLSQPDYLMNDISFLKKYFKNTPSLFKHDDINKCRAFLSMRLHGLIFAAQKCIPPITLSIYPKQINFMKEICLENCVIDTNKLTETMNKLNYVLKHEALIKEKIMTYRLKAIHSISNNFTDALNKTLH